MPAETPYEWHSASVGTHTSIEAWEYAFALLSLALLMQLGWTMRGMLL
jgi:hypothetical protein